VVKVIIDNIAVSAFLWLCYVNFASTL